MNVKKRLKSLLQSDKGGGDKFGTQLVMVTAFLLLACAMLVVGGLALPAAASSHREAPSITSDPQADNTDLYAFVSPDMTNTVTMVANYIPLEQPQGGPNFYAFSDNVLYQLKIDNTGDGQADIDYNFRFTTQHNCPNSFLYNVGQITSLTDPNWCEPQTYSVTRVEGGTSTVLSTTVRVPPVNIGPRSTPNYDTLAAQAVSNVTGPHGATKLFAGQRDDPFFVDLGSIFDLAGLRPFNSLHIIPISNTVGIDGVGGYNTHSIVLQVPMTDLTRDHLAPNAGNGTVGIWATSSRQSTRVLRTDGSSANVGPYVQVSRLGNPLINEAVIPRSQKDYWNSQSPASDKHFLTYYLNPELTVLENFLYPALDNANETNRQDLVGVLLTGLPGFNYTGNAKADMLRLNMTIPVAANPSRLGPLDPTNPDLQGFPNGRRLADDVTDIELRATAEGYGPTLAMLYGVPNRSPNNLLGDGVDTNDKPFLTTFPYVASPWQGYEATPPHP